MCAFRYDDVTVTLPSVQLTRVFFLYLNVTPSPIACHLNAVSPHFHQMNMGVHNIVLVFSRLSSSPILCNIATVTVNSSWTHS